MKPRSVEIPVRRRIYDGDWVRVCQVCSAFIADTDADFETHMRNHTLMATMFFAILGLLVVAVLMIVVGVIS